MTEEKYENIIPTHKGRTFVSKKRKEESYLLFEYENYEEYRDIQIKGFREKETHKWYKEKNLRNFIVPYIYGTNPDVSFGLCHGTRNGGEQRILIDEFKVTYDKDVKVVGTEIAPEAERKYPNTIYWDFHNVKEEWLCNVDFIYSNSIDHSYKPEECVRAWMSCLNTNGICVIVHSDDHSSLIGKLDSFAIIEEKFLEMVEFYGFRVVDILRPRVWSSENRNYIILKNK